MYMTKLASIAAALMIGTAPMAYAQTGDADRSGRQQGFEQQRQYDQRGQQQMGDWRRDSFSQSAEEDRLRDVLREAGFTRIRILDAAYVVRARTPDGRNVLMHVDPPARTAWRDGDQDELRTSRMGERQRDRFAAGSQQRNRRDGMDQDRAWQDRTSQDRNWEDRTAQGRAWQERMSQDRSWQRDRDVSDTAGLQRNQDSGPDLAAAGRLPEDTVRQILERRGISEVEDLRREGNEFVGTADWYGDEVDIRVDAQTGEVLQPERIERSQIRAKLQDEGWSDIREVEQRGDAFFARATRDGDEYELMLDGRTGNILAHRGLS